MGDNDNRLFSGCGMKVFKDLVLSPAIYRRKGIVENQYIRAKQKRASDGDPLLLPSGQSDTLLPYQRFVPVRQVGDVFINASHAGSFPNRTLRSFRISQGYVFRNGAGKQKRRLADHGKFPAPGPEVGILYRDAP